MSVKTDGVAHDLQNRIDLAMDELRGLRKEFLNVLNEIPNTKLSNGTTTYGFASKIEQTLKMDELKKIRDEIPCSCGKEVSGDISVETALEVEQVAGWIHSESDEPISEIEDLLLKMSTKDFYDEYEVVLETLKERTI